ncbi:hypothetical protein [Aliivibrio fischeri]|uniref:hypothetical protein n=1 Tax=Aliivibrio fischeri TaxID=668 RepID=UPI00084BD852|nr:hypothetical protein [Aliivibrio fischeri]OED51080.1 hypothetical protein BEI47_10580 [Aliivibrio fischeri]
MTYSVIKVSCESCSESYQGVLNDIFQVNGEYATTCPKCNKQTFIKNILNGGILTDEPPLDAVSIMTVKILKIT